MPYTFTTDTDRKEMLSVIGASSIEDLFKSIPKDIQLDRPLDIPAAMHEMDLTRHLAEMGAKNMDASSNPCFLGGGSYDHFIPAAVDMLASRGEFYTSYTPYQPEVSQGNLQAIFEYQSLICQLTGMDVSNASLYDGGSATIEAVLMSIAATRRNKKIVVLGSVHPEYRQVIDTYLLTFDTTVETVKTTEGCVDPAAVAAIVDDQTACIVVQHPNFFGCLEDVEQLAKIAHDNNALLVQVFDPMSLGVLKCPGELGADIAIAEGQSLGNPMAYGGPYLGILTCKESFMRKMPGRIAGQATSTNNRRCWVLTLQAREQHIKREKATSNICTNQGLFALRATIFMSLMGPQGMKEAGELCLRKSHYAASKICQSDRFEQCFDAPYFKEFVIRDLQNDVPALLSSVENEGILPGIWLGQWYPDLNDCFLVAVTEKRTAKEIDQLAAALSAKESALATV
jgi:glycine dehydrogenase subunit 1